MAPVKRKAAKATVQADKPLTEFEQRFCEEYLVDLNGTQAYLRVKPGAKETTAASEASRFLGKPKVQAEISRLRAEQSERTGITADAVILEAWNMLRADARELVEHRIGCCRYCWGAGHRFQRTDREYQEAQARIEQMRRAAKTAKERAAIGTFDPQGGPGFNLARGPNSTCPECAGEGVGRTVMQDTRTLSPAAASIYAGVEETKEGRKVKLHSKDAAMDKLMRHLGLYRDKVELTLPTVSVRDFTGKKGGGDA